MSAEIDRLRRLARLLDASMRIPGTRWTVGVDALLARMALNVAVEGLVGMIPLAGDVFDAAWKANQRNVRLLERELEGARRPREGGDPV